MPLSKSTYQQGIANDIDPEVQGKSWGLWSDDDWCWSKLSRASSESR